MAECSPFPRICPSVPSDLARIICLCRGSNHKTLISGIFCDLEKAFDCVSHKVLLDKLMYYGIVDKHLKLYKSCKI
jgi:hypothetical protein